MTDAERVEVFLERYLEHSGVKGMKWGVRKAQAGRAARATGRGSLIVGKAAGRASLVVGKATGRGIKKTAIYAKNNPQTAAKIAAGAAFVALMLRGRHRTIQKENAKAAARGAKEAARIFSQAGDLKFKALGSTVSVLR